MSVGVLLGIFYDFVPPKVPVKMKFSPDGKPLPQEHHCHQRSHLNNALYQRQYTQSLQNSADRERTDLWWIEPDGANVEDVMDNVAQRFLTEGLAWFERMTDIPAVYAKIQKERDCFDKYFLCAYFAQYLGRDQECRDYRSLREQETQRIERMGFVNPISSCPQSAERKRYL